MTKYTAVVIFLRTKQTSTFSKYDSRRKGNVGLMENVGTERLDTKTELKEHLTI